MPKYNRKHPSLRGQGSNCLVSFIIILFAISGKAKSSTSPEAAPGEPVKTRSKLWHAARRQKNVPSRVLKRKQKQSAYAAQSSSSNKNGSSCRYRHFVYFLLFLYVFKV